jgi:hypothetical protein
MILIDRLLSSGVKFVLNTLAKVADEEGDDAEKLRDELLAAQMRLELGEIDEEEFCAVEADVSLRLRAVRERERAQVEETLGATRVSGVEVTVHGDFDAR